MASCKTDFSLHPGTSRSDNSNKDFKMRHSFNRQNNNFAHTVHLFYTFLSVTTWLHAEPLISCFLEDINLDMLLRNLNPREFAYIRHSELDKLQWRLKEGKFPFLSDVFVACFQTSPFFIAVAVHSLWLGKTFVIGYPLVAKNFKMSFWILFAAGSKKSNYNCAQSLRFEAN